MLSVSGIDQVPALVTSDELIIVGVNKLIGLRASRRVFGYPIRTILVPDDPFADVLEHLQRLPPTSSELSECAISSLRLVDAN
jgi:hypothetical protein